MDDEKMSLSNKIKKSCLATIFCLGLAGTAKAVEGSLNIEGTVSQPRLNQESLQSLGQGLIKNMDNLRPDWKPFETPQTLKTIGGGAEARISDDISILAGGNYSSYSTSHTANSTFTDHYYGDCIDNIIRKETPILRDYFGGVKMNLYENEDLRLHLSTIFDHYCLSGNSTLTRERPSLNYRKVSNAKYKGSWDGCSFEFGVGYFLLDNMLFELSLGYRSHLPWGKHLIETTGAETFKTNTMEGTNSTYKPPKFDVRGVYLKARIIGILFGKHKKKD